MESMLFNIDFQLLHDFILFIVAIIIPLVVFIGLVFIFIMIIKTFKKKNGRSNCPYEDINAYH